MKSIQRFSIILASVLVAACNPGLLSLLREQLAEPERFFVVSREGDVCWLHFKKPVVRRTDLAGLGLPSGNVADNRVSRTYLLQLNDTGLRPVEVELQFSNDRLAAIAIPVIFYEILGPQNFMDLLRVAGGHTLESRSIDPISPEAIRVVFTRAKAEFDPVSPVVVVNLISTVAKTPSLALRLTRRNAGEDFQDIYLSLKPQPLPVGAALPHKS